MKNTLIEIWTQEKKNKQKQWQQLQRIVWIKS